MPWQVEGRRLAFKLPPSFQNDPKVRFQHGGRAFRDGKRTLVMGSAGCSILGICCSDSLAGLLREVSTRYGLFDGDSLYQVGLCLSSGPSRVGYYDGMRGNSPDSSDQRLFLTILHSIHQVSHTARRGHLFMGGNSIDPPYVLTALEDRLVVNGLSLPDVESPNLELLAPSGELETRRALKPLLETARDSILERDQSWSDAKEMLRRMALAYPGVKDARFEENGRILTVIWPSGYQYLMLSEKHAFTMGSGDGKKVFEQNEEMVSARLRHVYDLLNEGGILFLLGGGAEYYVGHDRADEALRSATDLAKGIATKSRSLPSEVVKQLRSPLPLQNVY